MCGRLHLTGVWRPSYWAKPLQDSYQKVLGGMVPALINPLMSRGTPFVRVVEGDIRHLLCFVDE